MEQRIFGKTRSGETAMLYTLRNQNGMIAEVSDLGATLCSLQVPDGAGNMLDVVLGHDTPADYEEARGTFFGATVGRNANRIGGARFALNGTVYSLDRNDGGNNLHSGLNFYHTRLWKVTEQTPEHVTLSLHSPDGDQGYPGEVELQVTYTLTADNALRLDYRACPQADTVLNLTNHSYFNLNGHNAGSIVKHALWVDADHFTRIDAELIPTGELLPVEGTPMDFRVRKEIGRDIDAPYEAVQLGKGYDHNWCLKHPGELTLVAELTGDVSGLRMQVYTDLPGMQIYSGNFLTREPGKQGATYLHRQGICFETQYWPDAVNQASFPSPVCKAGETYNTTTIYRFC